MALRLVGDGPSDGAPAEGAETKTANEKFAESLRSTIEKLTAEGQSPISGYILSVMRENGTVTTAAPGVGPAGVVLLFGMLEKSKFDILAYQLETGLGLK